MLISKSTLLEATDRLRSVPSRNSTLPCLGCVRITRNEQGNYPNFMQVVPEMPFPLTVRLDNQATGKALAALAKSIGAQRTDSVALRFDKPASTVTFTMRNDSGPSSFAVPAIFKGQHTPKFPPKLTKEAKAEILKAGGKIPPASFFTTPLNDITFNPAFLLDALRNLDTLHYRDAEDPALLTFGSRPSPRYVLMPMRTAVPTPPVTTPEPEPATA
jgi:hypothetical protein